MRRRNRGARIPVVAGERLLARADVRAPGQEGPAAVGATRDAIYLPDRIPWEEVASADWDEEERQLRVVEVGTFGAPRPEHVVALDDAGRLLQLVRERVTASIALQRHVAVEGRRSVRILARQAPGRRDTLSWFVEYDEGLDPADPRVDDVVQAALDAARTDVGG